MKFSVEESTKIHSASELDEMVRRAKSEPALEFEDEHTMIGNSEELAARSMSVPDVAPPRASSNVIRRTGPVMVARATSEPSPEAALGTESDVVELDVDEDDAFAAWDDAGQRTSPQSPDHLVALAEIAPSPNVDAPPRVEPPARAEAPRPNLEENVAQSGVEARQPAPIVMMPPSVEITKPGKLRIDRIVAIAVAAVLIGVIALGYRRIRALEGELAATKAALETATARSPAP